jgi:haloalkane dehalogenase
VQDTNWVDRNEYPFADHYLELSMGRMHYIDEGQGRPILLVHGTPEWSFGFRHLIKGLSKNFRCIACDHIGFGLSDKPANWSFLPEAHAENLSKLIESLNLEDFTLIVHDYGGPIGLSYAIDHPENIHSLVLMNTWMWSLADDPHFISTQIFTGPFGRFLYEQLSFSARVILPLAMGNPTKLTDRVHRQYLKPWRTPEERHGTWIFAREVIGSSSWYDSLWQRRTNLHDKPALILWGMKDFAFRKMELERIKTVFNFVTVQTFENIGHFVTEELGQSLTPIINNFLEEF